MCGIVGVIAPKNSSVAAYEAHQGLLMLQHRGQDGAGITSYDINSDRFYTHKSLGSISDAFKEEDLKKLKGNCAIAHTRYATTGSDDVSELQPMLRAYPLGITMAHNGNILNYHNLYRSMKLTGQFQFFTTNDLEVFLNLWCDSHLKGISNYKKIDFNFIVTFASSIFKNAVGAYSIVSTISNLGLLGIRDPQGIRPLSLGKKVVDGQVRYMLSSESTSFDFTDYEFVRDVAPGEIILIDFNGQIFSHVYNQQIASKHCMFEWVYFAGAESVIENRSVYDVRLKIGRRLGEKIRPFLQTGELRADIVCPVPDTGRCAALSLSETIGIPYREGLIKNRYVQRSFILNNQSKREMAVKQKLIPIKSEIEGKNILLVDDSIVRGTTSKNIVRLLKNLGAKSVSMAITCPPIKYPCYYGVDFPVRSQLLAHNKTIEMMEEVLGVDRLIFLDAEDLSECLSLSGECKACLDGKYPTDLKGHDEFERLRETMRGNL